MFFATRRKEIIWGLISTIRCDRYFLVIKYSSLAHKSYKVLNQFTNVCAFGGYGFRIFSLIALCSCRPGGFCHASHV
jgi:hypothetical protein